MAPNVFRQLAFGDRDDGVVLVARRPATALHRVRLDQRSFVAVLENIEKPGNLGAILRSADAAGIAAVVLAGGGTDVFNPNAIRASLGAIFHVPVAEASTREIRDWLRTHDLAVYAARVDGALAYDTVQYRIPGAVVLGNEAAGLSAEWEGRGGPFQPMVDGGVYFASDADACQPPEKTELVRCSRDGDTVVSTWRCTLGELSTEATYTLRLWQKSLVVDVKCLGGQIGEPFFHLRGPNPRPLSVRGFRRLFGLDSVEDRGQLLAPDRLGSAKNQRFNDPFEFHRRAQPAGQGAHAGTGQWPGGLRQPGGGDLWCAPAFPGRVARSQRGQSCLPS